MNKFIDLSASFIGVLSAHIVMGSIYLTLCFIEWTYKS